MKKIVASVFAPLALTFLLGLPALATTQASDSGQMSNMGHMGKMDHMHHKGGMGHKGEKHSDVRQAIHMLDHSKMVLQRHASDDPGGHKAEALKGIDTALDHLQMALKADQK
ncbi:MAG: hypothetical protein ACYC6M_15845 [Terriglobales bacterium]